MKMLSKLKGMVIESLVDGKFRMWFGEKPKRIREKKETHITLASGEVIKLIPRKRK